ncbi:MAG: hypothetical protein IH609_05575 [Dehalococcoidia bacterium]|nr:hypothetical protein [Dehalococcoidia bacterium]
MPKYFADEGFSRAATERLRLLGWDIRELVVSAPHLRGTDDVDSVLLYAKRTQRILLSADTFKDQPTRIKLQRNVRRTKRGKTLSVSGASTNHWTRTVGKLLIHQLEVEKFFDSGHGIASIEDGRSDGLKTVRPEKIPRIAHSLVKQGDKYLHRPKQLPLTKAKPPKAAKAGAPLKGIG